MKTLRMKRENLEENIDNNNNNNNNNNDDDDDDDDDDATLMLDSVKDIDASFKTRLTLKRP